MASATTCAPGFNKPTASAGRRRSCTKAIADAKAQRKTAEARSEAREEASDARHDAAEDKRDADYKVQLQRCDDLSGDAKDNCVAQAKRVFGKS